MCRINKLQQRTNILLLPMTGVSGPNEKLFFQDETSLRKLISTFYDLPFFAKNLRFAEEELDWRSEESLLKIIFAKMMINPLKKSRFCQLHWTFIPYDIFLKYLTKIQIKQIRIYIFCSVAFCWINGKNRTERKKREYLSRIFVPMGKVINFRREKSVKSDLHTRRCSTCTETYIILIVSSKTVTFFGRTLDLFGCLHFYASCDLLRSLNHFLWCQSISLPYLSPLKRCAIFRYHHFDYQL